MPTAASSVAATVATAKEAWEDSGEDVGGFDPRSADDYDEIDWSKLRRYSERKCTLSGKKSWRANELRWSRDDFDTQGNPGRYWLT